MEPVAGSAAGSGPLNLLFSIFFMRFSCWMEPIWALLPESLHRILLFFCEDGALWRFFLKSPSDATIFLWGCSLFWYFFLNPPSDTAFSFVGCSLLERFCQKPPSDTAISLYRCSSLDISCLSYHRIYPIPERDGEFVSDKLFPHHPYLANA